MRREVVKLGKEFENSRILFYVGVKSQYLKCKKRNVGSGENAFSTLVSYIKSNEEFIVVVYNSYRETLLCGTENTL